MIETATLTCASDFVAENFFDEQLDQSETKARLVQKYFFAWATIVGATAERFGESRKGRRTSTRTIPLFHAYNAWNPFADVRRYYPVV